MPALVLDDSLRLLRSIDPHICSVVLKPKTNNPAENYDLAINVFFGSENLRIQIGEDIVEFLVVIHKAEIVLDRAACKFDPTFERQPVPAVALTATSAHPYSWSTSIIATTGKALEGIGLPSASIKYDVAGRNCKHETTFEYNINFVREDTLSIEASGGSSLPLKGMVLDDYVGWKVIPDPDVKSGVIARVRVRDDWISLTNPRNAGKKGRYVEQIMNLIGSKDSDKLFRQRAFDVLLRHLVAIGFQQASSTVDATIAMDSVVVKPLHVRTERLEGSPQIRRLAIDENPLIRFLTSSRGDERQILLDAGVSPSKIPVDPANPDDERPQSSANADAKWSRSKGLFSVLIAQNNEPLNLLLRYNLELEGYDVIEVENPDEILLQSSENPPDIIILEATLQGGRSGFELCRRLRAQRTTRKIPVIILTDKGEEGDRVRGLQVGADDYIVKPFSVPEFLARVMAVLRRRAPHRVVEYLRVADITLDRISTQVLQGRREIKLTKTEFLILEFLMMNPGKLVSRGNILDSIWGNENIVEERSVDAHINRLRRALSEGKADDLIKTVRGSGYVLVGDVQE